MDDSATTDEDTPVTTTVGTNDTDADGTIAPATVAIVTGPTHGTLVNNNDGTVTYTPNANYVGPDSYTYTVEDNDGGVSNVATVTLTVIDEGAPEAVGDTDSTIQNTPVTGATFGNDSLIDGARLNTYDATSANGGTVVMNAGGTYTYTPPFNFVGTDTFTYTICDDDVPTAQCSTATVTITVGASTGQVAPTGTTAQQYQDGTAMDFADYYRDIQGNPGAGVIQYNVRTRLACRPTSTFAPRRGPSARRWRNACGRMPREARRGACRTLAP